MKFNILKWTRVVLALVIFLPILLFLGDFADIIPDTFSNLLRIQLIPAVLSRSLCVLVFLALLTLIFGRLYCSVICPMGILQDIVSWFTRRGKKKNKKKRWYNYSKPYNILRYSLLTVCILFLFLGSTTPLLVLDPYSNFGRIAVNLFRPVLMEGNNLISWVAMKFDHFGFYHVTIHTITHFSLAVSLIALLIVVVMSFLRGRLFCNTICPVGSLLGLISKYSVFRIILDDSCTHCGLCEKACKSQCINSKKNIVDHSRCVSCFNCVDRCKLNRIKYRLAYGKHSVNTVKPVAESAVAMNMGLIVQPVNGAFSEPQTGDIRKKKTGMSRRSFLVNSTLIATTIPAISAWAKSGETIDKTKLTPITPPGSRSLKHFKTHCTGCHLCITHCPQQILKPAGFNFGIAYALKPHMSFYGMAYCNYECNICSEVCPNGAIEKLTKDEKKVTQVGIAQFVRENCVVYNDNTSCGACAEHCPVQAVKMEPYILGLSIPHVYDELCIGCGGCESICPVRPIKAINVLANEFHQTAQKPKEEEMKEVNSEELDFGF
jgi:ferredoxin